MQTAGGRRKWRLRGHAPLRWRRWHGEFVLFDPFSGNTHRLDPLAGEIVLALEDGSKAFSEISAFAADYLQISENQELSTAIEEMMEALEDAGLVQRGTQ